MASQDLYGLIGKKLGHSFSSKHFNDKFSKEGLSAIYQLFELDSIDRFSDLILAHKNLKGLNVTVPYKELILPFLDEISPEAKLIGAVNTISIFKGKLTGYNTDAFGFERLLDLAQIKTGSALVFGTGGASKAVQYVLNKRNISFQLVCRNLTEDSILYEQLNDEIASSNQIWINSTPVGMFPNVDEYLPLPYSFLTGNHYVIDLVYNPKETLFLKFAKANGATTINGLQMLYDQAEKAWELWQYRP